MYPQQPAIAIARVSTVGQDEENQLPDIQAFANASGLDIIHTELVKGRSAFHGKHLRQVHKVIKDYEGAAQAVIFWKLDRSTRQGLEGAVDLRRKIRQAGMQMLFATQSFLNGNDAASELMFANLAILAQEESATKADRTRIKQSALKDNASFLGKPMLGYDIRELFDRNGKAFKTLVPSDAAPVVVRIFTEMASGSSLGKVARGLNADGIRTRRGKPFTEKVTLDILKQTAYRGVLTWKGQPYMTVVPLVSASLWQAANATVKQRSESGKGHGGGRPQLALLKPRCGECGGTMVLSGKGKSWASYYCRKPGFSPCGNFIRQAEIEPEVLAEFLTADDAYIRTTVIPGRDHSEEVSAVVLAIRDLDVNADDYLDRHSVLITELKRLKGLPAEHPRVVSEPVLNDLGQPMSEGDYFKKLDYAGRQAFIGQWVLTVWRDRSPRWTLTWTSLESPRMS